jgi:DNA mismatch repair ATPase MutS
MFSGVFVVYLIIATTLSSRALKAYTKLNGIVKQVSTLQQLLQWIEGKAFKSVLLQRLQQSAKHDARTGHAAVKQLSTLLDRFDMRLNIYVFLFLNSFLLWDVRQMIALNKWRRNNQERVGAWFHLVAELEVLNSLATLHFNQPQWSWPAFTDAYFKFSGKAIGHPLIQQQHRITSDFELHGKGKVAVITGSNMAGKSTFLRSLGVNTVLARIGAPVCAQALLLSPVQLLSSMRIADNLAENTSTFYAELKKLKTIIDAMKTGMPLFVLLDEVLRGTNSLDRHIGSKALIKQIIKEGAIAVIATHDVEVAKLEVEYPRSLCNNHFDVQVAGEELYFDYKLKTGVCTSLNASLLMKKIGIELDHAEANQA